MLTKPLNEQKIYQPTTWVNKSAPTAPYCNGSTKQHCSQDAACPSSSSDLFNSTASTDSTSPNDRFVPSGYVNSFAIEHGHRHTSSEFSHEIDGDLPQSCERLPEGSLFDA